MPQASKTFPYGACSYLRIYLMGIPNPEFTRIEKPIIIRLFFLPFMYWWILSIKDKGPILIVKLTIVIEIHNLCFPSYKYLPKHFPSLKQQYTKIFNRFMSVIESDPFSRRDEKWLCKEAERRWNAWSEVHRGMQDGSFTDRAWNVVFKFLSK